MAYYLFSWLCSSVFSCLLIERTRFWRHLMRIGPSLLYTTVKVGDCHVARKSMINKRYMLGTRDKCESIHTEVIIIRRRVVEFVHLCFTLPLASVLDAAFACLLHSFVSNLLSHCATLSFPVSDFHPLSFMSSVQFVLVILRVIRSGLNLKLSLSTCKYLVFLVYRISTSGFSNGFWLSILISINLTIDSCLERHQCGDTEVFVYG